MKQLGEPSLSDAVRVQVSRARRRLLYGQWEEDAIERIRARLGPIRRRSLGYPDLSANPFRSVCHQVAVLYDREPKISHPDAGKDAIAFLHRKLREALWASKMQRVQRDTIGIREMLVRTDVSERGKLLIRPVFPDRVDLQAGDDEPDHPARITEARPRKLGSAATPVWTYDELDLSTPSYTVRKGDGREITKSALGGSASGKAYPYVWQDGMPFLPYTLYHATPTGLLWDPFELRELVEATYESCVNWSFWGHILRDASWPQRWRIDLAVQGTRVDGGSHSPVESVTTDPATILGFISTRQDSSASPTPPGQFAPAANVLEVAEALMVYDQRVAAYAGVTDPDFIRRSGDPRSGYALAISRDGQRSASRKFEPQFRAGDEELLSKCAAQLNRHAEETGFEENDGYVELPESGWVLRYPGLPLTPDEQDARRRNVLELLDRGLMSRLRAYAELHELELEEAKAELEEIPDPHAGAGLDGAGENAGAPANGAGAVA